MLQIKNTLGGGKPEGLYVWKKYEATMITFYVNGGYGSYTDTLTCYEGETWESYASRNSKVTIMYGTNIFYNGSYLYSDSSYSSIVLNTDEIISGFTYYGE